MSDRPNILFLFPDQLRHDMLGCYGNTAAITPNLDALAAAGTRFQNAYTTNPVCLPARTGIITGKYCSQHHVHTNGDLPGGEEVCWPALLRDQGYYTALVGKLHLWEQYREPCFSPIDHGFQYKQMVEGKASIGNGVEESSWYFDILADRGLPQPAAWPADEDCRRTGFARISEYAPEDHIDGVIGARAVRQILQGRKLAARRDKPFCMQVGLCSPHEVYDPPQEFYDLYEGVEIDDPIYDPSENALRSPAFQQFVARCAERVGAPSEGYEGESLERVRFMRRCYLATVSFVDHQVGRIIDALKEAGIYEKTAIIFTSDHGEYTGDKGGIQKGLFLYENNLHVPLIVHAPFLKTNPSAPTGLVQNADIFATVLDLAGVDLPGPSLSRSLVPMLRDPEATVRDAAFAEVNERKMVRQRRWKLIVDADPAHLELYDIEADPAERRNLARDPDAPAQPTTDPELLATMNCLLNRLVAWEQACEATG